MVMNSWSGRGSLENLVAELERQKAAGRLIESPALLAV